VGKMKVLQSSLNGGEVSPKLKGRPELPRYQSGMEFCENFIPTILGGVMTRPGMRKVAVAMAAPDGDPRCLDVYTALDDDGVYRGFCLESDAVFVRPFKGYDIADTTPNLNSFWFNDKQSAQYEDYLYMVGRHNMPLRLKKSMDSEWIMEKVPFVAMPFLRPPGTEEITITPSALSGDITLTASDDFFLADHVDVQLKVNDGIIKVTSVTDGRHAAGSVIGSIPIPTGKQKGVSFIIEYVPPPVPAGFIVTCSASADYVASTLTDTVTSPLPAGLTITKEYSSANLTGTDPDKDWSEQAWSSLRGYPVAIAFFEQRMLLAGSKTYPTTVWGSKSGDLLDFTLGTGDDDGFAYTLASADTPIRSIFAEERIYVFTATKEITIETGNDKPLSPTNFRIKPRTKQGASTMLPLKIGSDIIFSSVSRNRLYTLSYRFDMDRFVSSDISIYGEHLISEGGGIQQVVVMREPIPMLWCRTAANTLITLTYDSEQQVSAWARINAGGAVTSIASVPDTDGNDQIWVTVERNGQTMVEAFDWALQTDSAVTGSDAAGKATWDGLDHLEGMNVVAVADGFVVQGLTVAAGSVTLPFPAKVVEVGLPFTARLKDLPPVVAQTISTISSQSSVNKIQVLLHGTKGCKVNNERIPFQQFDQDLLDKPVPAFTGWKEVGALGWGNTGSGGQVEIVRDLPLPCTVLAITKEVTVNA
jgi:hypothetical protein